MLEEVVYCSTLNLQSSTRQFCPSPGSLPSLSNARALCDGRSESPAKGLKSGGRAEEGTGQGHVHPRSALGAAGRRGFDWELWPAGRPDIATERKMIWSIRPQGTSAKNWCPATSRAAVRQLEWIVQGCTAKSFWAARWRWITALESQSRCQVQGHNTLTGSIEPE